MKSHVDMFGVPVKFGISGQTDEAMVVAEEAGGLALWETKATEQAA